MLRFECLLTEVTDVLVADICRAHHLVLLRHNLQNVGAKHRGTVLGEVIETWRAKVN